jgi:hypothetical protein
MKKTKSSLWNLRMIIQRLALLGCQLTVDTNGTPVPGTVRGSYIGSSEFASEQLRVKKDEMEWLMALVRGLRIAQLAYHLLRVCLSPLLQPAPCHRI